MKQNNGIVKVQKKKIPVAKLLLQIFMHKEKEMASKPTIGIEKQPKKEMHILNIKLDYAMTVL